MSKVYILQDNPYSPKNFGSAEEYGDTIVLFDHHVSKHHVPKCIHVMEQAFKKATEDDWLIAVGHPALILAAGGIWFNISNKMKTLVWDQQLQKYIPLTMEVGNGPSSNS